MVTWYSEADVAALLDPVKLIARIESGFSDLAAGQLDDPPPIRIDADDHAANYTTFPAYWPRRGLASVKVLSGVLENPDRGRPMIDAVVVVMDAATGAVRAIMGGRRITALRTAATSAIAVKHLTPTKVDTLAVIGTGAQGIAHVEMLCRVRNFADIFIVSATGNRARAVDAARSIRARTALPVSAADIRDAVDRADVIALATLSNHPLIGQDDIKPDALLISVGSFRPGATEIDPALVDAAGLTIADDASRLRSTWQSTEMPFAARAKDLSALVARSVSPRTSGLRVFLSAGRAFEDLAAATVVLDAAAETGFAGLPLVQGDSFDI